MWIADPSVEVKGAADLVMAIGGAIVVIGGAARWLDKRLTKKIESVQTSHDRVEKQVTPNGGDSDTLADQVVRIRQQFTAHTVEADERGDRVERRLDELAEDVREARELAVDTAVTAASAIRQIDEKVTRDLQESRTEAEALRASLNEALQIDNLGDD